ncbi:FHA domain-containing protein [Bombiscardovia coagulans]|uniref:FHA domain-containing protein n=1 Tax=Bombiscardovia coagulans TaxID=686666 RepID=A0A261EPF3_9BIFI|nr:FHA domain-containing protein [Bombiscardovia coagulans]OZG48735.1 FHA domain-containing protein [Bombiscardovia coagulans]
MKSRIKRNRRAGTCTLTIHPSRAELPDFALAQVLLTGKYADYLLPFVYEGDRQSARFYYDLTNTVSLSHLLRKGMTAERFAGSLRAVENVVRVCQAEQARLQTILWHPDYIYFLGDDAIPRMVQVPIVDGPAFESNPLSLLKILSQKDAETFGCQSWADELKSFLKCQVEFDASAYHEVLSSILPLGELSVLPEQQHTDSEHAGEPEGCNQKQTGDADSIPDCVDVDLDKEDDGPQYSETILKLPGAHEQGTPALTASQHKDVQGRSVSDCSYTQGEEANASSVVDEHNEDDEKPTSLWVEDSPRFRVTRIRDGRQVVCHQPVATIGRSARADIHMGGNSNVSRIHAEIRCLKTGGFEITDKHSSNGTRVSGTFIEPGVTARIDQSGAFSLADSDFIIETID